MYQLEIKTFSDTNLITQNSSVNAFLLTIPAYRIKSISNYATGTSASLRYITTIVYRIPN